MRPGTAVSTFTPSSASSGRMDSARPITANFAAQYGARCGTPTLAPIDVIIAIVPLRRWRMEGPAARTAFSVESKIEAWASSKSFFVQAAKGPTVMVAAFVTTMSGEPSWVCTSAKNSSTSARTERSQRLATTGIPCSTRSAARPSRSSS